MSGPRLSELSPWDRQAETVLVVLRAALIQLQTNWSDDGEDTLNRELYACFLRVNQESNSSGQPYTNGVPVFDSRNPPRSGTAGMPSERKLPDLQILFMDHQADEALECVRSFAIECKRIRYPTASGAPLNAQYVTRGVCRFISPDWKYGNGSAVGAMVGYVEAGDPADIVRGVNRTLGAHGLPVLTLSAASGASPLEMDHSLDRPFAVSPFRLVHLWIERP